MKPVRTFITPYNATKYQVMLELADENGRGLSVFGYCGHLKEKSATKSAEGLADALNIKFDGIRYL